MAKRLKTVKEVMKVDGRLKEVTTVSDEKGKILHNIITPLKSEFHPKDLLQVIVGASILAIPVGFTEETWRLGEMLPLLNIFVFMGLSFLFIGAFVYYNYFRDNFNKGEYSTRVLLTYILSFLVVAVLLSLLQKTPWTTDFVTAFSRVVLVTFPASMSAAVADIIH